MITLANVVAQLAESGHYLATVGPHVDLASVFVTGLASDSRVVRPGNVFACKGAAFRSSYLSQALAAGAVAYLVEEELLSQQAGLADSVVGIVVRDIRTAMGIVAPLAWGSPASSMRVIGVTGTKGKSTVTYMLRSILDADAGTLGATALIGSIETYDGIDRVASVNTTPEAPDLWRHLANARDAGLSDVVMEVSSQGLKYHRVDGLSFDVAAFLNLGRDHISALEHPNMEDYVASKLQIFRHAARAVVNVATERADDVLTAARASCGRVVTFGTAPHALADVYATQVLASAAGAGVRVGGVDCATSFVAHTPAWERTVGIALPGAFNVENALAAIAVAHELGVGPEAIADGLIHTHVPGRMEIVADACDAGVVGVVDFAHNALALRRFFPAVREAWPRAMVIAVFGATGDKGIERRVEMADEAAAWADRLVFTEDDPGSESVVDICNAMVDAVGGRVPTDVVPDRVNAIDHAVHLAFSAHGPVVICLVGRGTEPTMHRGNALVPFPLDADLLRMALAQYHKS